NLIITTAIPAVSTLAQLNQKILNCNLMGDGTRIESALGGVDDTKITFYLRNLGSRSIFFRRDGYNWNTIIV
ncbi:MAG: hypothetical protein QXR13_01220, partial [Candidatus Bathyarchaeia archaeon]